jgi:O-methyltransferase
MNPVRRSVVWAARSLGYEVWRVPTRAVGKQWHDADYYRPFFSPWLGYGEFARYLGLTSGLTLVPADRLYGLYIGLLNALQLDGEVWEAGVYRGGTARMLESILRDRGDGRTLRLFDTFSGLPEPTWAKDILPQGAFADTSEAEVRQLIPTGVLHVGRLPETFAGLEGSKIAFAHVDVDLYESVLDCLRFIYPRLTPGGWLMFDDYGVQTTPGGRAAVDEFFADCPETPLVQPSGQAIVIRTGRERGHGHSDV